MAAPAKIPFSSLIMNALVRNKVGFSSTAECAITVRSHLSQAPLIRISVQHAVILLASIWNLLQETVSTAPGSLSQLVQPVQVVANVRQEPFGAGLILLVYAPFTMATTTIMLEDLFLALIALKQILAGIAMQLMDFGQTPGILSVLFAPISLIL